MCIYQSLKICLMLLYFDQYGLLMAGDVFKKKKHFRPKDSHNTRGLKPMWRWIPSTAETACAYMAGW